MNGSGGGGGGEPVTWIVLHWQRCTVAPAAVAMAAAAAAAAVESAAPRMQKIVGRRLLPSPPPLLRPVHRDRATSAKNEGLVGGGQWMWRSLARPLALSPATDSTSSNFLLCLRSLPMGFFFRLALLLLLLLPVLLAFLSVSSRSLAGPAHWRQRAQATERGAATLRIIQSCNALWTHAPTRAVNLLTMWIYGLSLRNMSGVCRWFL